jgi:aminoglycoside 6'-N-acetyltransferase
MHEAAHCHARRSRCAAPLGRAAAAVLIDPLASNTRAHRFYGRLGFRFVERRRFGQDDCFVYRLACAHYSGRGT